MDTSIIRDNHLGPFSWTQIVQHKLKKMIAIFLPSMTFLDVDLLLLLELGIIVLFSSPLRQALTFMQIPDSCLRGSNKLTMASDRSTTFIDVSHAYKLFRGGDVDVNEIALKTSISQLFEL